MEHDYSTLPIAELLGILYAVWAELNRRLGLNHNHNWNHNQGSAASESSVTAIPCQEVCE